MVFVAHISPSPLCVSELKSKIKKVHFQKRKKRVFYKRYQQKYIIISSLLLPLELFLLCDWSPCRNRIRRAKWRRRLSVFFEDNNVIFFVLSARF